MKKVLLFFCILVLLAVTFLVIRHVPLRQAYDNAGNTQDNRKVSDLETSGSMANREQKQTEESWKAEASEESQGVGAPDDFSIGTVNGRITLLDWDDKVNIAGILGKPAGDKTEVLGDGADTFKGSSVRTLKYDGLEISMMSPKDNGKTFYVLSMKVSGTRYETARGIKVGDTQERLEKLYPDAQFVDGNKEDGSVKFENADKVKTITFSIKAGKVTSFEILYVLQ
jgi:hypothetical protein